MAFAVEVVTPGTLAEVDAAPEADVAAPSTPVAPE
jgi:hypothetical protein